MRREYSYTHTECSACGSAMRYRECFTKLWATDRHCVNRCARCMLVFKNSDPLLVHQTVMNLFRPLCSCCNEYVNLGFDYFLLERGTQGSWRQIACSDACLCSLTDSTQADQPAPVISSQRAIVECESAEKI
jgi:hypothetical protein